MALIELDLTTQPDPAPGRLPPAYRYRLPGLILAAVLAFALGGATPGASTLWRYLGAVPPPGGAESQSRLIGDRVYTLSSSGGRHTATAWQLAAPPRQLWTVSFPARVIGPDDVGFGGIQAREARDTVLLSDGPATTVVDAATGKVRWSSPVRVTRLSGDRIGYVQSQVFRPGTLYDQDSGDPGMLYFSATGEPHTEPPLRTEISGLDLRTGATVWTAAVPGSVNIFPAPGDAAAVLVLASDRLERLDGDTGAVERTVDVPRLDGAGPSSGSLADGLLLANYGRAEVAYQAGTLARQWQRTMPEVLDPPACGTVLCAGPRAALDVLDPATGAVDWRAPADVDLGEQGRYVVELDAGSGAPLRLVDRRTGTLRIDLAGWNAGVTADEGLPLVLRRTLGAGRSAFGVVLAAHDQVQVLGATTGPVSDCASDLRFVMCRGNNGLQVWQYGS